MSNDQQDGSSAAPPFALELARGLRDRLGRDLVGVYLYGSATTGDAVPGRSDVDLIAVCGRSLAARQRDNLQALLVASMPPRHFPAIDLGVLTAAVAARPERPVRWEMMMRSERNANHVALADLGGYPGDLPDVEMARQRGVAIIGPDPGEVFVPAPTAWVLEACAEELRVWARRHHYEDPASGVLNACRAWRYAEEGALASKTEGGEWARSRATNPSIIDAALAIRRGVTSVPMPDEEVNTFVRQALRRIEGAIVSG